MHKNLYIPLLGGVALCLATLLPAPLHGQSRNAVAWHRGAGLGYHSDDGNGPSTGLYFTGLEWEHRRTTFFSWSLAIRHLRVGRSRSSHTINNWTARRQGTHHGLTLLLGPSLHLRSGRRWEWDFSPKVGGLLMTTQHQLEIQAAGMSYSQRFRFEPSLHIAGEGELTLSYWLDSRLALEASALVLFSSHNAAPLGFVKELGEPLPAHAEEFITQQYAWWRPGSERPPRRQGGIGAYTFTLGLRYRL